MAAPDVLNSDKQSPDCIPNSGVAEDMVAIFGPSEKAESPLSAQSVKQAKISRTRSPLLAGLAVAGIATMLAAGVLAGQNAVNGKPKSAEPRSSQHQKTTRTRSIEKSEVTVARQSAVKPEASQPLSSVIGPAVGADANPIITARRTAPIEHAKSESATRVILRSEPIAVHPRQATASVVPVRLPDCNDGSGCFRSRLYTADRELLNAYNDAASAGVNARDLRAYRNEWLRARSLVEDRPKEALRIYGMIASDLRLFADEALEKADGERR